MVGKTLGHYEVLELLGAGGMGDVYLAEDTRLGRKVAIKVLPGELAADSGRRARFEREARAVAALDHPNIVTIHSIEEIDDTLFIVMQRVRGKTLSESIPADGLAADELLELAIPLADALSATHEQGVLHRDLKPSNVMVTDDGRVKVLDFGLAKLKEESANELTSAATTNLTADGKVSGTIPYMSPEQARGEQLDARSDLFSLGALLYEMATGCRAFSGKTPALVFEAILRGDTPLVATLNPRLPAELRQITSTERSSGTPTTATRPPPL